MPDNIRSLARDMLRDPVTVQVAKIAPVETVSQSLLPIGPGQKTALLVHLLRDIPAHESVLVFTKTKHKAKKIGVTLKEAGFKATSLQGNLAQNKRQAAMRGFRDGVFQIMVATDIASRGIDISQIFHVVNYDMPDTVEAYTHRIGRTGRASRTGAAYTFVTGEDAADVRLTERTLNVTIPRLAVDGFKYNGEEQQFHESESRAPRARPGRNQGQRRGNGGPNQRRRNRGRRFQSQPARDASSHA
jgi:ATP-dependent RNA helicase RhlE